MNENADKIELDIRKIMKQIGMDTRPDRSGASHPLGKPFVWNPSFSIAPSFIKDKEG